MKLFVLALMLLMAAPAESLAQMTETTPGGLRAYQFVFIAYALVWIFIGGWVLAIARRLARTSRDLEA